MHKYAKWVTGCGNISDCFGLTYGRKYFLIANVSRLLRAQTMRMAPIEMRHMTCLAFLKSRLAVFPFALVCRVHLNVFDYCLSVASLYSQWEMCVCEEVLKLCHNIYMEIYTSSLHSLYSSLYHTVLHFEGFFAPFSLSLRHRKRTLSVGISILRFVVNYLSALCSSLKRKSITLCLGLDVVVVSSGFGALKWTALLD
jgi:hypothetical protein